MGTAMLPMACPAGYTTTFGAIRGALLDVVDLLAAPATEPLVPSLVMEAMVRAYHDPEPAEQMPVLRLIIERFARAEPR